MSPHQSIVVCLSGRGDKDLNEVARLTGQQI
jgi:tryptophan synthase beta chain